MADTPAEPGGIYCPRCHSEDLHVTHTYPAPGNRRRRRRVCAGCRRIIITVECVQAVRTPQRSQDTADVVVAVEACRAAADAPSGEEMGVGGPAVGT